MHKLANGRTKWGLSTLLTGVVLLGAALLGNAAYEPLPAPVSGGPVSLTKMAGRGEYALIDFQSCGCFSRVHYRLRYEPTPTPHVRVTALRLDVGDAKSGSRTAGSETLELAVVEMSAEQVASLDSLLRYLRKQGGEGGCTTVDTISVQIYQHGLLKAQEDLVDSTCASEFADSNPQDFAELKRDDTPLLTFWSVIMQAAQAKTRGLPVVRYPEPLHERTRAEQAGH